MAARALVWVLGLSGCALPTLAGPSDRATWVETLHSEPPRTTTTGPCVADEATAVARALAQSPEAARFEGEAQTLAARSAMSLSDAPELRLSNLRLDRLLNGPERAELALRVPLARPGTLSGERRLLETEAEVARARAAGERSQLAAEVRLLWARLERAQAEVTIAAEGEAHQLSLSDLATRGDGLSVLDRQTLRAEHLRAQAERAAADGELARWREALAALTGPVCETITPVALSPLTAPLEEALSQRAELSRLFAERTHAALAEAVAARRAWPWLEWLQVGYEVDRGFAPDTFGFALAVSLPVGAWDGAEAEAERVRARGIEREARLWVARIEAEVTSAQRQFEARLSELARQEALLAALPLAAIDAVRTAAPREVLADDLTGLLRDHARLQRAVAAAREGALEARARLLAALGRVN